MDDALRQEQNPSVLLLESHPVHVDGKIERIVWFLQQSFDALLDVVDERGEVMMLATK